MAQSHIEYILIELLKNAVRATVEATPYASPWDIALC